MATNTSALVLATELLSKKLIMPLKYNLVFHRFGTKAPLPKGEGLTVKFEKFSRLSIPSAALTEGTAPAGSSLSTSSVSATIEQWGDFTKITDLAQYAHHTDIVNVASEILSMQAEETIDSKIRDVVAAGTNVIYATGAARTDITDAAVLSANLLRRATRFLRRNGVKPLKEAGGNYVCIYHPDAEYDLLGDTDIVSAIRYASPNPNNPDAGNLFKGEVGTWMGIRLVRSENAPTFASTTTVYGTLVFGQDAYGVSELDGSISTYITSSGATKDDPLNQFVTVGWKWNGKAVILDDTRIVRIEHGATYNTSAA